MNPIKNSIGISSIFQLVLSPRYQTLSYAFDTCNAMIYAYLKLDYFSAITLNTSALDLGKQSVMFWCELRCLTKPVKTFLKIGNTVEDFQRIGKQVTATHLLKSFEITGFDWTGHFLHTIAGISSRPHDWWGSSLDITRELCAYSREETFF